MAQTPAKNRRQYNAERRSCENERYRICDGAEDTTVGQRRGLDAASQNIFCRCSCHSELSGERRGVPRCGDARATTPGPTGSFLGLGDTSVASSGMRPNENKLSHGSGERKWQLSGAH